MAWTTFKDAVVAAFASRSTLQLVGGTRPLQLYSHVGVVRGENGVGAHGKDSKLFVAHIFNVALECAEIGIAVCFAPAVGTGDAGQAEKEEEPLRCCRWRKFHHFVERH